MVSGGPARSTAAPPAAEAPLVLEPFATSEFRSTRFGELRRVLGVSVEDHSKPSIPPISWEELKRFRVSVQESSSRARDRAKLLQEFIVKLDKYRNSVSRKRQKNESQSSEKVNGSNLLKTGGHMHQTTSDLLSHRLEDRTKNAVPKRRVRSSMTEASSSYSLQSEGKNTVPVKQGAMTDKDNSFVLVDKDNNMIRANNAGPIPSEEKMRALPAGGDGWEKKLKRKRSVGTMVARTVDGDRELKPELQQRSYNEPRHRSSDGLGFRTGSSNVIFGSTRVDGNSQSTVVSSRVILRNDSDSNSLLNERRERTGGLDKERAVNKVTNKLNLREDAQIGSQSLTKGKASRAPRTGSAVVMNTLSFPRSSGTIDEWEQSSSLNKAQPLTGAINRKRPLPTGSSSPPVQWASQRPLKISRSRRANVVSPVSNLDEAQALSEGIVPDVGARLASMENSGILLSRGTVNSSHQIKLKFENVRSPLGSSESEASGVPESKSKEKEKEIDNVEVEDGTLKATPKAAACVLPAKKNKPPTKEEISDGVRRQGRSGRGSMQSKACLPITKQKLENVETTKPVKSGKPVSDKTESRIGRPPSKKVSDCKGSRPGQITHSGSLDLSVEPEDDQKELLAAAAGARAASAARGATSDAAAQVARAAISVASKSCSGFWKQMEPVFACITSEDLAHVKHQIHFAVELDGGSCDMVDTDQSEMGDATCQVVPSSYVGHTSSHINVVGLNKSVGTPCSVNESELPKMASVELESETWFEKVIPLSQRLLSAFITEDEVRMFDSSIKQGDAVLEFSSVSSPYATNSDARNELNPEYAMDHDLKSRTNCFGENSPCYGCATPNSFRSPNNSISCDEMLPKYDVLIQSDARDVLGLGQPNLNMREALAADSSGTPSYECQFEHMPLDDRILMELHSIGIYPDTMPDLAEGDVEEIEKVISELKIKLYQEVQKKKSQLSKLEKAIEERKEHERRKLEQLAMEILVETAYKRQLCGRGGSSHKSGASKVSKQLALAFAKRTLARYRVFEKTGQSCFSEPVLHDHLFAEPLHNSDAKDSNDTKFGTDANMYAELRNGPLTSRVSASGAMTSGVSSNMIERHAPRHKIERGSLVPIQGDGEQTFAKSDSVSNRGKKREVLLDEIVTNARVMPALSDTLSGCAKWKETDKDKDVDNLSRHSVKRAAHPSPSASRGERKTKAKPKQNISQLPTSGNGAARVTETTTFLFPSARDSCETVNSGSTKVLELDLPSSRNSSQGLSKEMEDNVITNLPLQGIDTIDELDVADGLGGQGQDIASWLNVDEDALEDQDLICLQIPMDDLADLNLI